MNWVTRLFVVSLLTLTGTIGYGALHYAGPIYRNLTSSSQPNALFTGLNVFDMASTTNSSTFGSEENKTTSNRQIPMAAMTTATPMVTTAPPPYMDDDQNEQSSSQVRGTVTAVNGNMVTINGQTYTLAPGQSEVDGRFQVGSNVKVEYHMNPDGTLTIQELKVVNGSMNSGSSDDSNYKSNSGPSSNYYNGDDDGGDD